MENIEVVRATKSDAADIYRLGMSDEDAHAVSDSIRFYEEYELEEWASDPISNILYVAKTIDSSEVVGFFYCKIMSSHWAVLESFYVRKDYRGGKIAPSLIAALQKELKQRKTLYVSTLVRDDAEGLGGYIEKFGFQSTHKYIWYELFTDQ